ncbi:hypothetical protein BUE81_15735, partial [Escherichia coli]
LRLMISWIASTIFGVHYSLRNFRICQTVLRRRLRITFCSGLVFSPRHCPIFYLCISGKSSV